MHTGETKQEDQGYVYWAILNSVYIFEFQETEMTDSSKFVRLLIKGHELDYQMGMHISQHNPREFESITAAFTEMVSPMVTGLSREKDNIINMHQLAIPFTFIGI